MLRLIGILTGSALAVAFLIIALGLPSFSSSAGEAAADATEIAPAPETTIAAAVSQPAPIEPEVPAAQPVQEPAEEPVEEMPQPALSDEEALALVEDIFAPQPVDAEAPREQGPVDENWYAFWSPFRSEIAANGFVARLQETTGIDYRVVKVKPGVYEVAFAYLDDADIQDKLARISEATGLDMTGG
jgi:hypothetical protein